MSLFVKERNDFIQRYIHPIEKRDFQELTIIDIKEIQSKENNEFNFEFFEFEYSSYDKNNNLIKTRHIFAIDIVKDSIHILNVFEMIFGLVKSLQLYFNLFVKSRIGEYNYIISDLMNIDIYLKQFVNNKTYLEKYNHFMRLGGIKSILYQNKKIRNNHISTKIFIDQTSLFRSIKNYLEMYPEEKDDLKTKIDIITHSCYKHIFNPEEEIEDKTDNEYQDECSKKQRIC